MNQPGFRTVGTKEISINLGESWYDYIRIRVEQIEYEEQPAMAIFLENNNSTVRTMILHCNVTETKNWNENLESYTSTISHEFRTPISTCLMFLDILLGLL